MSTNSYQQIEMEINLKEVIWDLLEQWKAILITALIAAVLFCGAKYVKDVRSVEAVEQNKAEAEKYADTPAEERISAVLEGLSDEDATAAMNMASQYEWLDSQKAYLKNSILMNTDPTQQRVLKFVYYISGTEQNAAPITRAYSSYIGSRDFVAELKKIIAPNSDDKYIGELIQTYSENANSEEELFPNVLNIRIVMLDDTDADAVAQLVSKELSEQSKQLSERLAAHKLQRLLLEEATIYNYDGVNKKTNTIDGINNLQNTIKNAETNLSEEQKNAANTIYAILKESDEAGIVGENGEASVSEIDEESIEGSSARISKKFALLGFILGVLAYTFVYLLMLMGRKQVNYASDTENYTGARLLGEIYYFNEHKGLEKLTKSKFIEDIRYKGLKDEKEQIKKTVDTIAAVCKHAEVKDLAVLNLGDNICDITEDIEKKGIKTKKYNFKDYKEEDLLDTKSMLLQIGDRTKLVDVTRAISLCDEYNVKVIGSTFTGAR